MRAPLPPARHRRRSLACGPSVLDHGPGQPRGERRFEGHETSDLRRQTAVAGQSALNSALERTPTGTAARPVAVYPLAVKNAADDVVSRYRVVKPRSAAWRSIA